VFILWISSTRSFNHFTPKEGEKCNLIPDSTKPFPDYQEVLNHGSYTIDIEITDVHAVSIDTIHS